MSEQSDVDYEVLRNDLDKLRTEFTKLAELLRESVRHAGNGATREARRAGEQAWQTTRDKAEDVISQIEEKPVTYAAIAFGVGLLLGFLFGGRR